MINLSSTIEACLTAANGDRKAAADLLYERVQEAAVAGDTGASQVLADAARAGLRDRIDDFCRSHEGRVYLAAFGSTVPAGKSIHRRSKDGSVEQLRIDYLDMEWAELDNKIAELTAHGRRIDQSTIAARRYAQLREKAPKAKNAREALKQLGITADAWLNAAEAV